jgi:hypothetical protein
MFTEYAKHTVAQQFGLRSPKGDVGIEIETEGRNLPHGKVTGSFQGKEDGSLRNGMEYVSTPIFAKDVTERVDNLAGELRNKRAEVNPTYRSSTHIHVNYCDRTWNDVLNTMVIWALVEPVVFRMMPPGRDGSLFCVSSYDSGDLAGYADRFCTEISQNFEMGFHPRGKYSSLNLTRLSDLGTMEYRVFPSSIDGKTIQQWTDWVMNIREMAGKGEPLWLVREAEQNPLPFLREIFGDTHFDDAGQYVDFGARSAYEVARVINKHMKAPAPKVRQKKTPDALMAALDVVDGQGVAANPAPNFPAGELRFAGAAAARVGRRRPERPDAAGELGQVGARVEDAQIRRWRRQQEEFRAVGMPVEVARLERQIERRLILQRDIAAAQQRVQQRIRDNAQQEVEDFF